MAASVGAALNLYFKRNYNLWFGNLLDNFSTRSALLNFRINFPLLIFKTVPLLRVLTKFLAINKNNQFNFISRQNKNREKRNSLDLIFEN